jgi:hypothetical protein
MRLKSGRIQYQPGFTGQRSEMEQWRSLLQYIRHDKVTPVIGPGLTETLLGSRREVAYRWAETFGFPMAPQDRDDLPQVAQFLAVHHGRMFPRLELETRLKDEIRERYGDVLPEELRAAPLDELVSAAVKAVNTSQGTPTPHQVLAQLPLSTYLTTEYSRRLGDALEAVERQPQVEMCPWNRRLRWPASIFDDQEADYRPTIERPLVYHLFGRLSEPASVVLTEDDYFDFLIGVTKENEMIPGFLRRKLTDSALLFLGFRMDEWDFRVLFRAIMNRESTALLDDYAHVAVQIDPEEGGILDPERARRYLESFFQQSNVSIYWGSAEDFILELHKRWQETQT